MLRHMDQIELGDCCLAYVDFGVLLIKLGFKIANNVTIALGPRGMHHFRSSGPDFDGLSRDYSTPCRMRSNVRTGLLGGKNHTALRPRIDSQFLCRGTVEGGHCYSFIMF